MTEKLYENNQIEMSKLITKYCENIRDKTPSDIIDYINSHWTSSYHFMERDNFDAYSKIVYDRTSTVDGYDSCSLQVFRYDRMQTILDKTTTVVDSYIMVIDVTKRLGRCDYETTKCSNKFKTLEELVESIYPVSFNIEAKDVRPKKWWEK